jgi:hypothetical protein
MSKRYKNTQEFVSKKAQTIQERFFHKQRRSKTEKKASCNAGAHKMRSLMAEAC